MKLNILFLKTMDSLKRGESKNFDVKGNDGFVCQKVQKVFKNIQGFADEKNFKF